MAATDTADGPGAMDALVRELLRHDMATAETVIGCTPAEVEHVRREQRVDRPPGRYERFLRTMGVRAGELLRGTSVCYPEIVEPAGETRDFVREEPGLADLVEPGSVLIGMHQGYHLYRPDSTHRLHEYVEGTPGVRRSRPSLLAFLSGHAEEQRRIRERIRARPTP